MKSKKVVLNMIVYCLSLLLLLILIIVIDL